MTYKLMIVDPESKIISELPGCYQDEGAALEAMRKYAADRPGFSKNVLAKRVPRSDSSRAYGAYWSTTDPDTIGWATSKEEMRKRSQESTDHPF